MDRETEVYYVDTGLNKRYFFDEASLKNFVAECAESLEMEEKTFLSIRKTRIGIQRGDTVRVIGEGDKLFTVADILPVKDGGLIVIFNECDEVEDLKKVIEDDHECQPTCLTWRLMD